MREHAQEARPLGEGAAQEWEWTLLSPALLLWLARLLWTPKPTHEVLGLPKPISARVLGELDALQDDRNDGIADQIRLDAQEIFAEALRGRGVPDDTYQLLIGSGLEAHRVRRPLDGCSWSLFEFDDFIDLGLNPCGGRPEAPPPTPSQRRDDDR